MCFIGSKTQHQDWQQPRKQSHMFPTSFAPCSQSLNLLPWVLLSACLLADEQLKTHHLEMLEYAVDVVETAEDVS